MNKRTKDILGKVFLIISILMMSAGIILDVLVWMKVIATDEPQLVLHLSTMALIFSGFGNVIIAIVNDKN